MEKLRGQCNLRTGLYASVTGRREMLFSKSRQVLAASLCVKPAPGRVGYFATTSFSPSRYFIFLSSGGFRGQNSFAEKTFFFSLSFPCARARTRAHTHTHTYTDTHFPSFSLLLHRESCRNFGPNDSVRGCIRKQAVT